VPLSSFDVEAWAAENRYLDAKQLDDGRLVALAPMTYGKLRLVVGDQWSISTAY
jgi:hypothetical protein